MILYFADRKLNILGLASTLLPKGICVLDDSKTETLESGVKIFEAVLGFTDTASRQMIQEWSEPANYLLRSADDENEFYTIIESTVDTLEKTVRIYCEDAGLDMINDILPAYAAPSAMTAAQYVNMFAADSGFVVGDNEISNLTRKLQWDGEETAAERIRSVCTQFDNAELSFSFEIKNLRVTNKYINLHKKRGADRGVQLRLDREINSIQVQKSAANLATALNVVGGTPDGKDVPITLKGYAYDDGDIYSPKDSAYLYSRSALEKWSRKQWEGTGTGHLVKQYSYETTSQAELCKRAVNELKSLMDIAVNYEIDVNNANDKQIMLGDTVYIVDDAGEMYLSARVQEISTSVINEAKTLVLGDYVIKAAGISDKVTALAQQFNTVSKQIEANTVNQLHIDSSNGFIFKEAIEATALNVTVFRGSEVINNMTDLIANYGSTAYLQWSYIDEDSSEYTLISASDSRLSNDSFTLTISSADIVNKLTFRCQLMIEGQVNA